MAIVTPHTSASRARPLLRATARQLATVARRSQRPQAIADPEADHREATVQLSRELGRDRLSAGWYRAYDRLPHPLRRKPRAAPPRSAQPSRKSSTRFASSRAADRSG